MKKANACISLVTVFLLIVHVLYQAFAFLFFFHNPVISAVFGYSLAACMVAHAVLSVICVVFFHDSKKITYAKLNSKTLLQRISAGAIVLLLAPHITLFSLLSKVGGKGPFAILIYSLDVLFYLAIFTHVPISFPKALITLGLLSDPKKLKGIEIFMYVLCTILFFGMSVLTVYTLSKLFSMQ